MVSPLASSITSRADPGSSRPLGLEDPSAAGWLSVEDGSYLRKKFSTRRGLRMRVNRTASHKES